MQKRLKNTDLGDVSKNQHRKECFLSFSSSRQTGERVVKIVLKSRLLGEMGRAVPKGFLLENKVCGKLVVLYMCCSP